MRNTSFTRKLSYAIAVLAIAFAALTSGSSASANGNGAPGGCYNGAGTSCSEN